MIHSERNNWQYHNTLTDVTIVKYQFSPCLDYDIVNLWYKSGRTYFALLEAALAGRVELSDPCVATVTIHRHVHVGLCASPPQVSCGHVNTVPHHCKPKNKRKIILYSIRSVHKPGTLALQPGRIGSPFLTAGSSRQISKSSSSRASQRRQVKVSSSSVSLSLILTWTK